MFRSLEKSISFPRNTFASSRNNIALPRNTIAFSCNNIAFFRNIISCPHIIARERNIIPPTPHLKNSESQPLRQRFFCWSVWKFLRTWIPPPPPPPPSIWRIPGSASEFWYFSSDYRPLADVTAIPWLVSVRSLSSFRLAVRPRAVDRVMFVTADYQKLRTVKYIRTSSLSLTILTWHGRIFCKLRHCAVCSFRWWLSETIFLSFIHPSSSPSMLGL